MDPTEAWKLCGEPTTAGNIAKRARTARARKAKATEAAGEGAHIRESLESKKAVVKAPELRTTRRTSHQVDVERQNELLRRDAFSSAFKEATEAVRAGRETPGAVVIRLNKKLATYGGRLLKVRYVTEAVKEGHVGRSPKTKGPKSKIPKELLDVTATWCKMNQIAGKTKKPRDVRRVIKQTAMGTAFEKHASKPRQLLHIYNLLLREYPELERSGGTTVDERRWLWTTYSNLNEWFEGFRQAVLEYGFGFERVEDASESESDDEADANGRVAARALALKDDDGKGELCIPLFARKRICNIDETQETLDNEGESGGSRQKVLRDRRLGPGGRRKYEVGGHVTGFYGSNAAGEMLPALYIFDSSAKEAADRAAKLPWLFTLPRVKGQFGHESENIYEPFVAATPKGSTEDWVFEEMIEKVIKPLYPEISPSWTFHSDGTVKSGPVFVKTDGGPGRLGKTTLAARRRWAAEGIILFPGLPNATAANQEMDQLFGPYKMRRNEVIEEIIAERAQAHARELAAQQNDPSIKITTTLGLTKDDLGRIVNGKEGDPLEKRPFEYAFAKPKVLGAWEKVGAVPLTREGLKHPKVRHEAVEGDLGASEIQEVEKTHRANLEAVGRAGLDKTVRLGPLVSSILKKPRTVAPDAGLYSGHCTSTTPDGSAE